MERRLTYNYKDIFDTYDPIDVYDNDYSKINFQNVLRKLAHYEDLEEQGRLIELPCAVGDTAYVVEEDSDGVVRLTEMKIGNLCVCGSVYNGELWNMYLTTDYMYSYKTIYDIGRTVFLTKAEAEAALKESEQE